MTAAIIILIGGSLSVIGVYIAARQAMKDSVELDKKNEKIIGLTEENARLGKEALDQITGGTSWAYLRSGLDTLHGIMNQPSIWTINVVGDIPLYDVTVSISEIIHVSSLPTKAHNMKTILSKEVGTVTSSLYPEQIGLITLPSDKNKVEFLARIKARNGEIIQHIIFMKMKDNYWRIAEKIFRYKPESNGRFKKEILKERIDIDFPQKDIEWVEI